MGIRRPPPRLRIAANFCQKKVAAFFGNIRFNEWNTKGVTMAAPTIVPANGFNFTRNLSLLNGAGSVGINISSEIKPDVAAALASATAPFPARDIDLAEVGLEASTPKPIEFARGADKISFSASLKGFAGLGVYRSGANLLKRLGDGAEDFSLEALEFGDLDTSLLSVLRWGYDASGKVS
jgi:hypothetical protein